MLFPSSWHLNPLVCSHVESPFSFGLYSNSRSLVLCFHKWFFLYPFLAPISHLPQLLSPHQVCDNPVGAQFTLSKVATEPHGFNDKLEASNLYIHICSPDLSVLWTIHHLI